MNRIKKISQYYPSKFRMEYLFEKWGRKDGLEAETLIQYLDWKERIREILKDLIGLDRMETCPLNPQIVEKVILESGIIREKVIIQTEPEIFMPLYILIPIDAADEKKRAKCCLALHGHQGAGKYSVAGCRDIPAVSDKIEYFNYDYGLQLAKAGYVAICPDARGFGERRDPELWRDDEEAFLNSTCFQLAHMAEPLGLTVIGLCVWDLMRLIDYIFQRDEWDLDRIGSIGFSGGGMQTLWLMALDDRIQYGAISGYMYGYKDSLLKLCSNCSCNYVPHLWEHVDMGDIGALIAPRPLTIQSCKSDHLNGERGLDNVYEQMNIIRKAYELYNKKENLVHDLQEGDHCWHGEFLREFLEWAAV